MCELASSILISVMLMRIITSSGTVSYDDDYDDEASVKCEKIPRELASCPHLIN